MFPVPVVPADPGAGLPETDPPPPEPPGLPPPEAAIVYAPAPPPADVIVSKVETEPTLLSADGLFADPAPPAPIVIG